MKLINKLIAFILIVELLVTNNICIFSHDYILNIDYDDCIVPVDDEGHINEEDGEDEIWYCLESNSNCDHISNSVTTIYYYFSDTAKNDPNYTWATDVSESEAIEIKNAYVNSMKKWNNVYYYTYDGNGQRTSRKIINFVEVYNENSSNLIIYPTNTDKTKLEGFPNSYYAVTGHFSNGETPIETDDIEHYHYQKWYMKVNVDFFKSTYYLYGMVRERTGQHELGHVLGLRDVDSICSSSITDHHEEILMGYGNGTRSTYAKYKDIAGVSITRGFHTDADHVWMLRENKNDDGTHKSFDVICALCNGVRFAVDQEITESDGSYWYSEQQVELFGSCNGAHSITGENMLLVATDGIRDFYKCLHCRYIEEVEHVHVLGDWKKVDNYEHQKMCVDCHQVVEEESHNVPENWTYKDQKDHKKHCSECDSDILEAHIIRVSEIIGGRAPCIYCKWMINVGDFSGVIHQIPKVSLNGSYILPNGVIVLVDEDVEAYLNGTLVFYDRDKLPEVE